MSWIKDKLFNRKIEGESSIVEDVNNAIAEGKISVSKTLYKYFGNIEVDNGTVFFSFISNKNIVFNSAGETNDTKILILLADCQERIIFLESTSNTYYPAYIYAPEPNAYSAYYGNNELIDISIGNGYTINKLNLTTNELEKTEL